MKKDVCWEYLLIVGGALCQDWILFLSKNICFLPMVDFVLKSNPHPLCQNLKLPKLLIFSVNIWLFSGIIIIPSVKYTRLLLKGLSEKIFPHFWDIHWEEIEKISLESCLPLKDKYKNLDKTTVSLLLINYLLKSQSFDDIV